MREQWERERGELGAKADALTQKIETYKLKQKEFRMKAQVPTQRKANSRACQPGRAAA